MILLNNQIKINKHRNGFMEVKYYYRGNLIFNIMGVVVLLLIAKMNEAGGNSLGYVLIGFPFIGGISIVWLIVIMIADRKKIAHVKGRLFLCLLLCALNIWEILLLRYLA